MTLTLADRVRDTTATIGTGTITLSGTAPTGYQTFETGVGNGNTTYYTINAGNNWEVGIGTYSSTGPTLTRDTVLASSASGAKVDFPAGTKDVFVTYPAERSVYQDGSSIKAGTATLGVANGGTGATSLSSGYLVKGNGTSAASASVVYDGGTNVGIGTTLPGKKLDLVGQFRASGSAASGYALLEYGTSPTATNNWHVGSEGDGTFRWYNGNFGAGSERMRITSAGLVGINTTSPAVRFHVNGNTLLGGSPAARWSGITLATDVAIQSAAPLLNLVDAAGTTRFGYLYHTGTGGDINLLNQQAGAVWFGTNNAERMRITSDGNVGIGTSAPGAKLRVVGTSGSPQFGAGTAGDAVFVNAFDSNPIYMTASATNSTAFGFGAASNIPLFFMTNNTERMRITAAGDVGIGTSSPIGASGYGWLTINGASTGSSVSLSAGNTEGFRIQYAAEFSTTINTIANIPMLFQTNNTERMRIDSSGNVGIGTSSPGSGYRLHTAGGSPGIAIQNTSTGGGWIDFLNSAGTVRGNIYYDNASGYMTFGTSASGAFSERMRIDSSGNLLVGTTSNTFSSRSVMRGSGVANVLELIQDTGSTYSIIFTNSSGTAGSVTTSGATTQFNTSSDARLKHDIVDAPEASSLIDAIKVRSFKWNADDSEQRYGMVAQELLEVAPEAVSVPADEDEMMGVDYSKLVPMLVKEIQSLRARVAQLEGN